MSWILTSVAALLAAIMGFILYFIAKPIREKNDAPSSEVIIIDSQDNTHPITANDKKRRLLSLAGAIIAHNRTNKPK